jgi:hypothetical protein
VSTPPTDPPQPTFQDVVNSPFLRGLLILSTSLVGFGAWGAVAGLEHTSRFWDAGCAVVGGLLVASVLLNFVQPGLKDSRWSKTRTRRAARSALSHFSWVFVLVVVASALIYQR